jgi:putative FmdB family regulatory protein
MPFYEYECASCKFYTEVMQKISDPPLEKCPSCGKKALKKLVSAPVFRLKGAGWYETDFKSDQEGKRNLAGAEREEPSAAAKTDEAPEAKPAKEADAKPAAAAPAAAESAGGQTRRRKGAAKTPSRGTGRQASGKARPRGKAKRSSGRGRKGRR